MRIPTVKGKSIKSTNERLERIIEAINNPLKRLGEIDLANLRLDVSGTYAPKTLSANVSMNFTDLVPGVFQSCILTFSGQTLTVPLGTYISTNDFSNGGALTGSYRVWWWTDGYVVEVGCYLSEEQS